MTRARKAPRKRPAKLAKARAPRSPRAAPTPANDTLRVVGLGASAGGLEALDAFFANMPAESGMAFVVVTHQHADRTSLLPELIARKTKMPVTEVTARTLLERDHVYLPRPGFELAVEAGVLVPSAIDTRTVPTMPIDRFFRSLAHDQREHAVGIVLSGTGIDGTLGIESIKDELGMVMAQDEVTAQYAGMPHSAIATRLVDYVVAAADMPEQLLAYARGAAFAHDRSESLAPLFSLIKTRNGHDFSGYKLSTIRRRVERRMQMHHMDGVKRYARYLQSNANEIDLLCKELLIGVTSFFRDADAWRELAAPLCELLANKPDDFVFRAWVPGCSTGEEAYSLAILVSECMAQLGRSWSVQIFGTDLEAESIAAARISTYAAGIAHDVSPERLARFFVRTDDGYQIRNEIRKMVVFAPHSVIADPPFTKIDLVSCRNLLIYLEYDLQRKVFPLFHHALRPGGLLFLGTSESLATSGELFETIDNRWKIFRRREVPERAYVGELPLKRTRQLDAPDDAPIATNGGIAKHAERLLLRELMPPTVLVREGGDVVYIHGRTGLFLEPAQGPHASANIFNMAREGLQVNIAAAMRQAVASGNEVIHRGVRVTTNGNSAGVDLHVVRVTTPEAMRGLYRITFEHASTPSADVAAAAQPGERDRVADLERELRYTKENQQVTNEELETANEELKSTNEELQSTNEELQSSNEELETSKEELQALNEELQALNAQLQAKLEELSYTNDDMRNLLNGTEIATVFIDNDLRIKRFTEQATSIIRLIPSDIGRPLRDLTSSLRYEELLEDAREVLRTLSVREAEIQGEGDAWYLMRILPYRTAENLIDGLVLTFVDITKSRALQVYERRLLTVLDASTTAIFGHDRQLRYRWTLGSVFGRTNTQLEGKTDVELFGDAAKSLTALKRRVLATGASERARVPALNGANHEYEMYVEPVRDEHGVLTGLSCMMTEARMERVDVAKGT